MKIYRIAQKEQEKQKKEKRPYSIIRLAHGVETKVGTIWAYSSEQARMFAIKNYSRLRDDLAMGYEIVARLDKEKWEELERAKKVEEELKEEQIQTAWWQD